MKITIAPNTDQIRHYANSALAVWGAVPDQVVKENVIASMTALLQYLDACDAGNGVVICGMRQIERGVRLEISRQDGQSVELTDMYVSNRDVVPVDPDGG